MKGRRKGKRESMSTSTSGGSSRSTKQPVVVPATTNQSEDRIMGLVSMALLALQFGLQPFLTKTFTSGSASKISIVLVCEVFKFGVASCVLCSTAAGRLCVRLWEWKTSLACALVPAMIYAVQNICLQVAYQYLNPTTFQLINQTKILWTALFTFVVLSKKQSRAQCAALVVLVFSAVLITTGGKDSGHKVDDLYIGLIPAFVAALLSGLASALSQWSLQGKNRNTYLFSAELAVYTSLVLLVQSGTSAAWSGDWKFVTGFFTGWTPSTLIPVATNGVGGVIVGLVTKYAGSVSKGYSIVAGILLTATIEILAGSESTAVPAWKLCVAVPLVAISTLVHTLYPPAPAQPISQPEKPHKKE
ncbi:Nucleotide-sugar transporter family protein [Pelomyxa schiedti]|nr:Nucleotide-sugar transporter family protein [Pelomyxa schiedti]